MGRHGFRKGIAQRNLAAAFPGRSPSERRAIARGAFTHFGRLALELLRFATLSPKQMLKRVEFDGEERARVAYAQGKGVLFITGHFGFWELQAMVHALRIQPVTILARALDNPYLDRLLERIRQRTGNTVVYRRETIRRVMRTLQAGQGVAVLIDQHIMSRDAIYVDFFERPAATTSAVAALALRTGAPVVPVFALPLGRGQLEVHQPERAAQHRVGVPQLDHRLLHVSRLQPLHIRLRGVGGFGRRVRGAGGGNQRKDDAAEYGVDQLMTHEHSNFANRGRQSL